MINTLCSPITTLDQKLPTNDCLLPMVVPFHDYNIFVYKLVVNKHV